MTANPPEYDRNYRFLRKKERKEEMAMLLKVMAELKILRKEMAEIRQNLRSPIKILSSSSESTESRSSVRESEQARLARLDSWKPNSDHQERANQQGSDMDRETELYRLQQANNPKVKHKDFDSGFMSWLIRAPTFEGNHNGNGNKTPSPKANGHAQAYGPLRDPSEIMREILARDAAKEVTK